MEREVENPKGNLFWFGVVVGAVILFGVHMYSVKTSKTYEDGLKQGQIDCMTGKIYYQLVEQPDRSVIWQHLPNDIPIIEPEPSTAPKITTTP